MKNLVEITDPDLLTGDEMPGHYYSEKNAKWWTRLYNFVMGKFYNKNGS